MVAEKVAANLQTSACVRLRLRHGDTVNWFCGQIRENPVDLAFPITCNRARIRLLIRNRFEPTSTEYMATLSEWYLKPRLSF